MSVGPSALGTLLVQRLDAVLGTTMAQHANLITGARPDAVSQAAQLARINTAQDATHTDLRHSVERVAQHADPRTAIRDARLKTALDADGRRETGIRTSSASTQLGGTARLILALLAQYPGRAPAAAGRQPLWQQSVVGTQTRQDQARTPAAQAATGQSSNASGGQAAKQTADGRLSTPRVGGPTAGITGSAASVLAAATAPNAAVLARALGQMVSTSGMFYESHLADLAFGKRSPEQLAAEPQARLDDQNAATRGPAADSPGVSSVLTSALPGAEAALLVRQQLEVLAYQMFSWQGEAWPDAPMDWEIHRHGGEDDHDAPAAWATRLRLELPKLGEVEARLSLAGDTLAVHLCAPDCADLLQAQSPVLRGRCEANGLVLTHLSVDATANHQTDAAPPSPHADEAVEP